MLPTPTALLLDFGGVIVESGRSTASPRELVARVHRLVGGALTEEEIERSLAQADGVRKQRRNDSTDFIEFSHEQLWGELVAEQWPAMARAAVLVHAADLTRQWARRPDWRLRAGMADLLDFTIGRGMPVAVVSNTRSGQAHRDMLDELGVTGAFAAQVYSDELGVFKPHPSMIYAAARELNVPVGRCWFVGDQVGKDIVCARRAGAGAAILMPRGARPQAEGARVPGSDTAPQAEGAHGKGGGAGPQGEGAHARGEGPQSPGAGAPAQAGPQSAADRAETTPDAVVADGTELLALLRQAL